MYCTLKWLTMGDNSPPILYTKRFPKRKRDMWYLAKGVIKVSKHEQGEYISPIFVPEKKGWSI